MPRVKRREREIERTRQDILDAAARVFGRVGYGKATMQEIAREAGYTAPSLYTYFEGKQALLKELFERFFYDVLGLFERPIPRGLTLAQSLELLMTWGMQLADDRRDAMLAFASFAAIRPFPLGDASTDGEGDRIAASPLVIVERLAQWLQERAGEDELGGLDPSRAAFYLFGLCYSTVMRWNLGGCEGNLVDEVPRTLDFFFCGLQGCPQAGDD